ncbi:hypothetical protein BLNAU_11463 [Blattamonas nauphoetae]|uniref:Uncharacterized protein n=1 Tax=Blattamonas nauphoetae TaxID=2049346 RepID=A0ABQ9XPC5_9EUKA|nr:hypothetical protein BLNAU_11463 [Blattamonas nauphoetae]
MTFNCSGSFQEIRSQTEQLVAYFRAISVNGKPFIEVDKTQSRLRLNKKCFRVDLINPARKAGNVCRTILQHIDSSETLSDLNKENAKWDSQNIKNGDWCSNRTWNGQTYTLLHIGLKPDQFAGF